MNNRVFISGKTPRRSTERYQYTLLSYEVSKPDFFRMYGKPHLKGYYGFNHVTPADIRLLWCHVYRFCEPIAAVVRLHHLLRCSFVCFAPEWYKSRTSLLEYKISKLFNKIIIYL